MSNKALIISHNPFSSTSNNGKTLEAIFKDYKSGNLHQLFFSDMTPDLLYSENYFRLTDKDVIKNTFFRSKSFYTDSFNKKTKKDSNLKSKKINSFESIKRAPFIRDLLWTCGRWKTKELFNWIEKINIDYVFYVGGPYQFSHIISSFIAEKLDKPLVLYLTDDYLLNPINRNWIDVVNKKRMEKFYEKTINQAVLCFAIGDSMAEAYQSHYNKPFHAIMNMVEIEEPLPYPESKSIAISYFGGLHLDRWKEIVKLGKVLSIIRKENLNNLEIELNVYAKDCSNEIQSVFKENNVIYKGFIDSNNLRNEFYKSDILLHVESNNLYYRSLTKLSVSTKIPEYLSTGRCVLGFGPEEVASMRLLIDNNVGVFISSDLEEHVIVDCLKKIIDNKALRQKIAYDSYQFALKKFNPEVIREEFNQKISEIL